MTAQLPKKFASSLLCLALSSAYALGHGGGGDIALFNTDGKIDIGFATLDDNDINQTSFNPNDRVFQAVLTPLNPNPVIPWSVGSTEPGFDANEGELLPEAEIFWDLQSLKHWDGTGEVVFTPVTGVDAGYARQARLTDSVGGFHSHPTFGLKDSTDDSLPVADGVYLAEVTVRIESANGSLVDSDPFYLVSLVDGVIGSEANPIAAAEMLGEYTRDFLSGASVDAPELGGKGFGFYAAAIQHVEALAVPEPNAALLLTLSLGFLAGRHR